MNSILTHDFMNKFSPGIAYRCLVVKMAGHTNQFSPEIQTFDDFLTIIKEHNFFPNFLFKIFPNIFVNFFFQIFSQIFFPNFFFRIFFQIFFLFCFQNFFPKFFVKIFSQIFFKIFLKTFSQNFFSKFFRDLFRGFRTQDTRVLRAPHAGFFS